MDDKYFRDCLCILHFYMVNLLKTFDLKEVSDRLLERIIESRGSENDLIVNTVVHFFEDCRNVEPGSTRFIKMFVVDVMVTMFGAYGMTDTDLERLLWWVARMHDNNDWLIRFLKNGSIYMEDFSVLVQYVEKPNLRLVEGNSSNPPEQEMTWSRRMAALVFDVKGYSEATKRRLQSAALFIIENDHNDFTQGPDDYHMFTRRVCQKFMGAKLMALNMVELEAWLIEKNRNRDIITKGRMKSLIEGYTDNLERTREGIVSYPIGTKMSQDMITSVVKELDMGHEYVSSDDICVLCQGALRSHITQSFYCDHFFHVYCLVFWLTEHRLCPICRGLVIMPWLEFPSWVWEMDRVQSFLDRVY